MGEASIAGNRSRDAVAFWALTALQAAASQTILWQGVPIYRNLLLPRAQGAGVGEMVLAVVAVLAMQIAYWLAFPIRERLRFRRHVVLGHVLVCLGELTVFFATALATVILFERLEELEFAPGKALVLAGILFASFCYKHQLKTVGEAMIDAEPTKVV